MKTTDLLKSILNDNVYEALNKALVKLNTNSVVDIDELHAALKTAPKSVIAFLMKEVKDMEKDQAKEIKLPWHPNSYMLLNKLGNDVYKGHIVKDSKIIHNFDLTAIPQLATHLMSTFELYDEKQQEEKPESKLNEPNVQDQLKALENKINALMMLVVGQPTITESVEKSEDIKKNLKKFDSFLKSLNKLKKAGLAPKMPSPPRPGTNVGGNQGITRAGLHGDKTEHTDLNQHPVTHVKNPYLKAPKENQQPKQPKTTFKSEITVNKSEINSQCTDCGQVIGTASCACFKALSKPDIIKKSENNITLLFDNDWTQESIVALYKSIKRYRNE